jgi:MFS family permease
VPTAISLGAAANNNPYFNPAFSQPTAQLARRFHSLDTADQFDHGLGGGFADLFASMSFLRDDESDAGFGGGIGGQNGDIALDGFDGLGVASLDEVDLGDDPLSSLGVGVGGVTGSGDPELDAAVLARLRADELRRARRIEAVFLLLLALSLVSALDAGMLPACVLNLAADVPGPFSTNNSSSAFAALGWMGSLNFLGLIVGGLLAGPLLQRVDQRRLVALSALAQALFLTLFAAAGSGSGSEADADAMLAARFFSGLAQAPLVVFVPVWVATQQQRLAASVGAVQASFGGVGVGAAAGGISSKSLLLLSQRSTTWPAMVQLAFPLALALGFLIGVVACVQDDAAASGAALLLMPILLGGGDDNNDDEDDASPLFLGNGSRPWKWCFLLQAFLLLPLCLAVLFSPRSLLSTKDADQVAARNRAASSARAQAAVAIIQARARETAAQQMQQQQQQQQQRASFATLSPAGAAAPTASHKPDLKLDVLSPAGVPSSSVKLLPQQQGSTRGDGGSNFMAPLSSVGSQVGPPVPAPTVTSSSLRSPIPALGTPITTFGSSPSSPRSAQQHTQQQSSPSLTRPQWERQASDGSVAMAPFSYASYVSHVSDRARSAIRSVGQATTPAAGPLSSSRSASGHAVDGGAVVVEVLQQSNQSSPINTNNNTAVWSEADRRWLNETATAHQQQQQQQLQQEQEAWDAANATLSSSAPASSLFDSMDFASLFSARHRMVSWSWNPAGGNASSVGLVDVNGNPVVPMAVEEPPPTVLLQAREGARRFGVLVGLLARQGVYVCMVGALCSLYFLLTGLHFWLVPILVASSYSPPTYQPATAAAESEDGGSGLGLSVVGLVYVLVAFLCTPIGVLLGHGALRVLERRIDARLDHEEILRAQIEELDRQAEEAAASAAAEEDDGAAGVYASQRPKQKQPVIPAALHDTEGRKTRFLSRDIMLFVLASGVVLGIASLVLGVVAPSLSSPSSSTSAHVGVSMFCFGLILLCGGALVPCAAWLLDGGVWAAVGSLASAQARALEDGHASVATAPVLAVDAEELMAFAQALAQVAYNVLGYAIAPVLVGAALDVRMAHAAVDSAASSSDLFTAASKALSLGLCDDLFLALPLLCFLGVGFLAQLKLNQHEAEREDVARAVFMTTGVWGSTNNNGTIDGLSATSTLTSFSGLSSTNTVSASISAGNTLRAQLSMRRPTYTSSSGLDGGSGAAPSPSLSSTPAVGTAVRGRSISSLFTSGSTGGGGGGSGSMSGTGTHVAVRRTASSPRQSISRNHQQQQQRLQPIVPLAGEHVVSVSSASSSSQSSQQNRATYSAVVAGIAAAAASRNGRTQQQQQQQQQVAPQPPTLDWSRRGSVVSFETSSVDAPVAFTHLRNNSSLNNNASAASFTGALSVPQSPMIVASSAPVRSSQSSYRASSLSQMAPLVLSGLRLHGNGGGGEEGDENGLTVVESMADPSPDGGTAAEDEGSRLEEEELQDDDDDDNYMLYGRAMQDE